MSGAERYTLASSTQTIGSLDPLLVTTGEPGLNSDSAEAVTASTER